MPDDIQFSSQLKDTMSQLRADLNAAFGDTSGKKDKRELEKGYLKEKDTKQLLKLTEYLLRIKEKQIAGIEMKNARYYAAVLRLSGVLVRITAGEQLPEPLLAELCAAIDADGIVIWRQEGREHRSGTVNIDKDSGEELFMSVLPYLAGTNSGNSVFTREGRHFIANTRQGGDVDSVFAVLYVRGRERPAFDGEDGAFAAMLTDVIYNLLRKTE